MPETYKTNTGRKDDNDKPRYDLVFKGFAPCITQLTYLSEFGAQKYGENNWQQLENGADRYMNGLLRHLQTELDEGPGTIDQETQLLHATAIAWNALAYLWFVLKGKY